MKQSFGILVAPLRYVIYSPDLNDFLAFIEVRPETTLAEWHHTPAGAIAFDTLSKAEEIAHLLYDNQKVSGNRKYRIQVCELSESDRQFQTRPVAEIVPRDSIPNTDTSLN